MTSAPTIAGLLCARIGDDHPGLLFEDQVWTWDEVVRESAVRAALITALCPPGRPFHVGVLMENTPEYVFLLGGAALAGATIVGVNPTRRGEELARDVRHTDCALLIGERPQLALLDGLDAGVPADRVLACDEPEYELLLAAHRGAVPEVSAAGADPATQFLLMFTSGSTGAPKAVRASTGRIARYAALNPYGLGRGDVAYNAMPLFHGNALMACWGPSMGGGGTFALRRRFSASGFVPDVRRYGVTFFNYVGRSLAYILARPEDPEAERGTRLRLGYGTEASVRDREEFTRRFGCPVIEGYGSSEGAIAIRRTPDTPPGALGLPMPGQDVAVIDLSTGKECPPARFDADGRLVNAEEAIGEIVNRTGAAAFEGYYRNPAAEADRVRGDWFLSGDLGFRDEAGFFHFAGRGDDWLRVDGENFASAPVENILGRAAGVVLAVVYAVPDTVTGDQVMATLQLAEGSSFDAEAFEAFLAGQRDLGTKWAPRYVRISPEVPVTATRKTDKKLLRREGWATSDPVFWRPAPGEPYRRMTAQDAAAIRAEFARNSRVHLLTG